MKTHISPKSAFTLIELLTVIAVIAILSAILIPVLAGVRERAGTTQTVSNLKQVYACFQLYANENKGSWPAPRDSDGTEWSIKLYPYVNDGRPSLNGWDDFEGSIFTSPNALTVDEKYPGSSTRVTDASNQGFGMNCYLPSVEGGPWDPLPPEQRAPRPGKSGNLARQMLLMDCNARIILGHEGFKTQYVDYTESRHSGKNTILFADGHTDLIDHERFFTSGPATLYSWFNTGSDAGLFWQGL